MSTLNTRLAPSPTLPTLPRVVKAVRTSAKPVPASVQLAALQTTARFVELARTRYGRAFPMPTVAFDLRGKTAGQAFLNQNMIRYNAVLLTENQAEFDAQTIPHEVAHLIAHQLYGAKISGHGPEWQKVMRDFGVQPRRCHSYDVTNSAVGGVHQYTCRCNKTFALTAKRHKKAQRGGLICRKCRSTLRPIGAATTTPIPAASAVVQPTLPLQPLRPSRPTVRVAPPPSSVPPKPTPVPPKTSRELRPATPAMLQFALSLAHKLGIALQAEHVSSFDSCADFINRFKGATAVPSANPPSDAQLKYARDIARRKGLSLSPNVLGDRTSLSAWLKANH